MTTSIPSRLVMVLTTMLRDMAKARKYEDAITMFKENVHNDKIPLDNYISSLAIRCYSNLGKPEEAFGVLGLSLKKGIEPNEYVYSALLDSLVRQKNVKKSEWFFNKMLSEKFCKPNLIMYSMMAKLHSDCGNFESVNALLVRMNELGVNPDVVLFNSLIDSFCKQKRVDSAIGIYQIMTEKHGVIPDKVTYTSLIDGCTKSSRVEEASGFLKQMIDRNIQVDPHVTSVFIHLLCSLDDPKEAEFQLGLIEETGVIPDVVNYNTIIDAYCKTEKVHKAIALFDSMMLKGVSPNSRTLNIILAGFCATGRKQDAMLFLRNSNVVPDSISYSIMIIEYTRYRQSTLALMLYYEMREKGFEATENILVAMMGCLCKDGRFQEAIGIFSSIEEQVFRASIKLQNIVKRFSDPLKRAGLSIPSSEDAAGITSLTSQMSGIKNVKQVKSESNSGENKLSSAGPNDGSSFK